MGPSHATALALVQRTLPLAGEFWECGVYRGNTARILKDAIGDRTLRLFDTFTECPDATDEDHGPPARPGAGARVRWGWETSLAEVQALLPEPSVRFHVGCLPETFQGLEDRQIAFCYLDLTLYRGTRDALAFVWPRLVPGGSIFVRDYYGSTVKWPGLVRAVDESGLTLFQHGYDAVIHKDV